MQAVKTRMREKVVISVAIVLLATGSFMFAQKYVKDHAQPRYPNEVSASMDAVDYGYLCTSIYNEVSNGIISLGASVQVRDLTMNHNELSANALAFQDTVQKDITRMDAIKPPTAYASDYMNFVGQLTAINAALTTFSNDAKANDIKALQQDKKYLMSLGGELSQYTPQLKN